MLETKDMSDKILLFGNNKLTQFPLD